MARKVKIEENHECIVLDRKEINDIICLLTAQLCDVGAGGCPTIKLSDNGSVKKLISFVLEQEN
jgi:hypothetical protein